MPEEPLTVTVDSSVLMNVLALAILGVGILMPSEREDAARDVEAVFNEAYSARRTTA